VTPTIAEVLAPAVRDQPDAPALVAPSGTLSYAELDRAASSAAGALWQLGVRPGDRVGACLPNDLDIAVAFHGAQRIGAIWAGVNEAYPAAEQQAIVDLIQPTVIVAGSRWTGTGPAIATVAWRSLLATAAAAPHVATDPDAPAGIGFTSGTTGAPKGVVHSQRNLLLPGEVLVATRGWGPALRKGDCLPLTLLNMLVLSTLLTARAGGCCVLTGRRDVDGVAEWIAAQQVTVWNGVPAQLHDLAGRPGPGLSSLEEVWCGGAALPDELRRAFEDAHQVPVRATYGLSEAPTVVAIDPVSSPGQPGASGRVLPHLDVAAYAGDGRRLPAGEAGELRLAAATAGPWAGAWTPALGQWRDGAVVPFDDLPVPATPFPTGDVGTVGADGWLTVTDRRKLVIVRGGANVYPAEVERVIRRHPAVAEAVVFGVPDDRLGEKVAALVQFRDSADPKAGLAAVEDLCRAELARYKVPEAWSAVDAFPLNPMGKIIRTGLATLLSGLLFVYLEELLGGAGHCYVSRLQPFRRSGRAAWVYLHEWGDCGLFPDYFSPAVDPAPDPDHGLALPENSCFIITIWSSVARREHRQHRVGGRGQGSAGPRPVQAGQLLRKVPSSVSSMLVSVTVWTPAVSPRVAGSIMSVTSPSSLAVRVAMSWPSTVSWTGCIGRKFPASR
jgi:long-chain acyl-CoA synthetase